MKIQIVSPEIGHPREQMNHDYWVRQATSRAIEELGHEVLPYDSPVVPDIQLVFSGMASRIKTSLNGKFTAVWCYSRPDEMDRHISSLRRFNQIYTLSDKHTAVFKEKLKLLNAKPLRIATDKFYTPADTNNYEYDFIYMGSSPESRVKAIEDLANNGFKIGVCGWRWKRVRHPNIHVIGEFWPNHKFSEFFNKAPLSYYPTAQPFIDNGIVPIRVMDIYACSDCLCLVEKNPGMLETFSPSPPMHNTTTELVQQARHYLSNPTERLERQKVVRESIRRTYRDLVLDVIVDAMCFWSR